MFIVLFVKQNAWIIHTYKFARLQRKVHRNLILLRLTWQHILRWDKQMAVSGEFLGHFCLLCPHFLKED